MKRLGVYTRYSRLGASSRLRYFQYEESLQAAGFAPRFHALFQDLYLKRLYAGNGRSRIGVLSALLKRLSRLPFLEKELLIEYELLPGLPAAAELFFIGKKRKYVLNFDDLVWEKYRNKPLLQDKYDRLISRAAGVIVANHMLLEKVSRLNSNVILIPTAVRLENYRNCSPVSAVFEKDDRKLTAAWIGTPVTFEHCFLPFAEMFAGLSRKIPLQILAIGGDPSKNIDGLDICHVPWSSETEAALLAQCDLGIMPLTDDSFSRGKSAYKLIQYMAAGLPAAASPVGENCHVIHAGKNGFLADSPEEWYQAFAALHDPGTRRIMAENASNAAYEYSVEKYAPVLTDFLQKSFAP